MKHTPSPWTKMGDEIYGADGARVAEAVAERDVQLLLAAPEVQQALRELVDLEDMRLRLRQLHEMGHGTDYENYYRRLPLAWAAARAALSPNAEVTGRQ